MIKVFHIRSDVDRETMMNLTWPLPEKRMEAMQAAWPSAYTEVAQIDSDDLDEAWVLTQNGHRGWTETRENPSAVRVLCRPTRPDEPCRSSMVGDIYVLNDQPYAVDAVGFSALVLA
jgi:hypothetical protein